MPFFDTVGDLAVKTFNKAIDIGGDFLRNEIGIGENPRTAAANDTRPRPVVPTRLPPVVVRGESISGYGYLVPLAAIAVIAYLIGMKR